MSDTKLYSWFLGPKAENADLLERLVLEALRDCVFWRRNFHPEDDILITEKVRRRDEFQDSHALLQQEFAPSPEPKSPDLARKFFWLSSKSRKAHV